MKGGNADELGTVEPGCLAGDGVCKHIARTAEDHCHRVASPEAFVFQGLVGGDEPGLAFLAEMLLVRCLRFFGRDLLPLQMVNRPVGRVVIFVDLFPFDGMPAHDKVQLVLLLIQIQFPGFCLRAV